MERIKRNLKRLRLIRGQRRLLRWSKKMRSHLHRLQTTVADPTNLDSEGNPKLKVELLPNLMLTTTRQGHEWMTTALSEMILVLETMAESMGKLISEWNSPTKTSQHPSKESTKK